MSEIHKWLEEIGVGQYADAFEANEIGMDLGQVDDQMLKDRRRSPLRAYLEHA